MKKILIISLLTALSSVASAKSINCEFKSISTQYFDSNKKLLPGDTKDYSGSIELIEVSNEEYAIKDKKSYEFDLQNISQNPSTEILLKTKFGSRFALTGYYGTKTVSINKETGLGKIVSHIKPHLISDLNAPQPERVVNISMQCEL